MSTQPPHLFADVPPDAPADPLVAVTHPDPYPYYRHLAWRQPFHRDERLRLWIAAGPAEVDAVLHHPACRVRPPTQPVPPAFAGTVAGKLYGAWIRMNDGALHAALKGPLQQTVAGFDLAHAHALARQYARELPATAHPPALVNHAMSAVPVLTMAGMLGWSAPENAARAAALARDIAAFAAAMSPLADADTIAAGIEAARRCADIVATGAGAAWRCALLERAGAAGRDDQIVAANLLGLMIQSCEATAALIGNTLVRLGRGADDAGASLPAVVARVLHDDPPIHNTRRFVAEDTRVCGVPLRQGDGILVLLAAAAAARADHAGASPTFGAGPHRCPGTALAGVLAEATIAALLDRGIEPSRLASRYRYRPSLNARIPQFL